MKQIKETLVAVFLWLNARMKEGTSWAGLGLLATMLKVGPEQIQDGWGMFAAAVTGVAGFIAFIRKERGSDQPPVIMGVDLASKQDNTGLVSID